MRCLGLRTVHRVARERGKVRGRRLGHRPSHVTSGSARYNRLLTLDDHGSHDLLKFQQYCKENKIITLCMPRHSSHILQPLDVGYFSPMKTAYGRQAKNLV
jgi:hypothetical protein